MEKEEEIIAPIPVELLKQELTEDKLLRKTNKGNNEIYIVTWHNAPNVLREIGRLREIAFRSDGGGTGLACDLDDFDTCENCYKQIVLWNPEANEIIGGYRYICGTDVDFDENGQPILATSHMFHFSDAFIRDYLPNMVELGRSFVSLKYQSTRAGVKAIFALDNLWDGIGAVTVILPHVKYLFGKMTMYPTYNRRCRDMILYFLGKHFADTERLVYPFHPIKMDHDSKEFDELFSETEFKEDYRILNREVRAAGLNIPPLVNSYMNISPTMKFFGTAINDEFGDVEETGILITISEIFSDRLDRHINTFTQNTSEFEAVK